MKQVKFHELDAENKDTAVTQMLQLSKKYNWSSNIGWEDEDSVKADLEQDYNADDRFSFYLNEFSEVETKLG